MKKEIIYFNKLEKTNKSNPIRFKKKLSDFYNEEPYELNLTNNLGDNFVFFKNSYNYYLEQFIEISDEALKLRSSKVEEYLNSGYIVSEINSSLRAEGVHSTKKIIEQVIRSKKSGKENFSQNTIEKIISNMYECMRFIISNREINEKTIYMLYMTMTNGIDQNIIEEHTYYRLGEVSVGFDEGTPTKTIKTRINQLIEFINTNTDLDLLTKSIISHYYFEDIHPYYDFNGRMGRMLQLWVLLQDKTNKEFWRMIFMSEAIYSYKGQFDAMFTKQKEAKKAGANIDLTYPSYSILNIFYLHTKNYLTMKKISGELKKPISRHLSLFIIDILCDSQFNRAKWYDISFFREKYDGYAKTVGDRVLVEIVECGLFEVAKGRPIKFRLKTSS